MKFVHVIRTFSLWLMLTLSLWSMSALADSAVDESLMLETSSQNAQTKKPGQSQSADQNAETLLTTHCAVSDTQQVSPLQNHKRLSSKHTSFAHLLSKVEAFFQDKHIVNSVAPDAALQEVSNSVPEYWLLAEFNPPDPAIRDLADIRFAHNELPWYLSPNQRQRLKLSAWKDSNCQYRSKLTFYS